MGKNRLKKNQFTKMDYLKEDCKVITITTSDDNATERKEKIINKKGEVLTIEEALICVGGNREFFKQVVAVFLKEYPKMMSKISAAITTENATMLDRSAHKLKGSIYNFGSHSAGEIAFQLEEMGKSGDLTGAEKVFFALVEEMESLYHALKHLVEGKS